MEKTLFQNLIRICTLYKGRLLFAFFLILLANCCLFLNPLLLRVAVSQQNPNPFLWCALFIGIAFMSGFFRYRMRLEFNKVSRIVERDFRSALFSKIQNQSMEFYDRYGVGELIERLSNDVNAYRDVLGPGLLFPAITISTVVPGIAALFYISPLMASITLIPLILIPVINILVRRHMYGASRAVQLKSSEMGNFVQEDISGIRAIKSYVAEESAFQKFSHLCFEFFGLNFRLMCYQGWFIPMIVVFIRCVTILLVLLAGFFVLSPADFASFMWIQSYIFFPIVILGWVVPVWQQGRSAYDRLKSVYDEPNIVKGSSDHELKLPPSAEISFNHLTFAYPGQPPVLNDITLTIPGGSFVGLSGPPGSGKSTLFKLLNREYEIPHGMISIGKNDIHDYPLTAFWQEIVSVEQIPFLFSKSVRENVSFGKEGASETEIFKASELAGLHDTIMGFEQGYETLVGEKGVNLSGGQKSRVAIARAFLVSRSILLLDDIFSSLDNQTAQKILKAIKENMKGRTIFINTSKANILEQMDRVVFLSKGKVLEEGTPEELYQKGGLYTTLKQLEDLLENE